MTYISYKEFETLNWLPVTERFNQCISSIVFKYANDQCPNYLNEIFQTAPKNNIQTRGSFLKLKCPFHKTNAGQMGCLTLAGPILESKGMRSIFQKKGKDRAKKGKVFENSDKNIQNLKVF